MKITGAINMTIRIGVSVASNTNDFIIVKLKDNCIASSVSRCFCYIAF